MIPVYHFRGQTLFGIPRAYEVVQAVYGYENGAMSPHDPLTLETRGTWVNNLKPFSSS